MNQQCGQDSKEYYRAHIVVGAIKVEKNVISLLLFQFQQKGLIPIQAEETRLGC